MKTKTPILSALLVVTLSVSFATQTGRPEDKNPHQGTHVRQLVVHVHKAQKGLEYEMKAYKVGKADANYWLAEIKLRECNDCQIIPLIDDNVELGAISQISEMAINAGFTDIRPFVYWPKTGRIAEVQFGPPIKFTSNEEKLTQRIDESPR